MIAPLLDQEHVMRRFILLLLIAALLPACATSPTGRSQFLLVSPEAAIAQSRPAYLHQVNALAREGKLLKNPVLSDRVEVIAGRLVAETVRLYPHTAGWEWSVALIDAPKQVNAWCMAGGRMAIYSGLVYQLDLTDDELAQVIGHEISHALANHTAEQMSLAIAQGLAVAAVQVRTGDERVADLASSAASVALGLPNSRTAESEADQIGMELATRAGYDPHAAVTLWAKMARHGGSRPPEFLSTHPSPENRAQTLAAMARDMRGLSPAVPPRPYPITMYP